MKKILIIFLIFIVVGCAGPKNYVFDHTIIKQINIKNPSFTLVVENDQKNYYINQVEDAFIKNKIVLYSDESQIVTSATEGKSSGVGVTNRGSLGVGVGKSKSSTTEKTINLSQTNATCIYYLDCYNWTFKVISADTKKLLMKGRIKYDFDQEVAKMYGELTGSESNHTIPSATNLPAPQKKSDDHQQLKYSTIKGIILKNENGETIYGEILNVNSEKIEIQTKDGKVETYPFNDVYRFINE
jgi:hypothetical protein